MKTILKLILSVAFILIVLFGLIVVGVLVFLPPEKVKDPLLKELNQETHLTWKLSGPLSWNFFPKLGLEIHDLTVTDPATNQIVGRIGEASARVNTMRLIHGDLEVDELLLKDSDLDASPVMLVLHQKSIEKPTTKNAGLSEGISAEEAKKLFINSLKLNNVSVHWKDPKTNQLHVIKVVDLTNKNLGVDQKSPLHFLIQTENFPSEGLNTYELSGSSSWNTKQVALHDAKFTTKEGLNLQNINLNARLSNDVISLEPMSASAYSGELTGDARVDMSGKTPIYTINGNLAHLQVQPFLKDLYHYERVTGTVEGDMKLHSRGNQSAEVIHSLNGTASFKIMSGELQGIDILYWISVGESLLQKKSLPSKKNKGSTDFAQLNVNFVINNGIATTNDFKLWNALVNVEGHGEINLNNRAINFHLSARQTGNENGIQFPIIVTGEFGNAHIQIDPVIIQQLIEHTLTNNLLNKLEGNKGGGQSIPGSNLPQQLEQGIGKAFQKWH